MLTSFFRLHLFIRLNLLILILFFLLPVVSFAEVKNDTLVVVNGKKGDKMVKAQIYNIDSNTRMLFYKPKPFEFVTSIPSDLGQMVKTSFKKSSIGNWAILMGSSLAFIAFDQQITNTVQKFGNYIHLDPKRKFKTAISFTIGGFTVPVLDLPQNLNSTFYFMGEGWPSILIAGGFLGFGIIGKDYRAQQTASQLSEMFFSLALTVQMIKRISGRESPFQASAPGGVWRPFTNLSVYQNDVSRYDALPSGHIATVMATVTILSGNYPEKRWIKPVGYSLMGVLGLSMIHNSVHWMGDYPLAIAIGYTCGKIAMKRGHVIEKKGIGSLWGKNASLMPFAFRNGGVGVNYRYAF